MVRNETDEAFEWLVLIIGIVVGIMSQYPELFWPMVPYTESSSSVQAAKGVVIPLLMTLMIWLVAMFTSERFQPVIKVIAWFYVSVLICSYLLTFLWGIGWIPRSTVATGVGMLFLAVLGPVVIIRVILPRYRETYPGSRFLHSWFKLLLALVAAGFFWGLMVVAISG